MKHLIIININGALHEIVPNGDREKVQPVSTDRDSFTIKIEGKTTKDCSTMMSALFREIQKLCMESQDLEKNDESSPVS